MKKTSKLLISVLLLGLAGLCGSAFAADSKGKVGFVEPFANQDNWQFEVATGVRWVPKYEGSDNMEAQLLLSANAYFNEGRFFAGTGGVGVEPLRMGGLTARVGIGYEWGREESDDRKNLRGMGDVDDSFTGKFGLAYTLDMFRFGADLSTAINGDYGTTITVYADSRVPIASELALSWRVFTQWADDEHMENNFGVSRAQSLRSGKQVYEAESGFKKIGIEMGMDYKIIEHVGIGAGVGLSQLLGDAEDSPLSRDDTQIEGRLFLTFGF